MEQQKKRNRLIALTVCLLMLATLMFPMNVQKVDAATTNLQNPRIAADGTVAWDCVYFGHYPQGSYQPTKTPTHLTENEIYTDLDGTHFVYIENPAHNMGHYYKIEPIKWRVLSIEGDEAFLLADRNLDGQIPYLDDPEIYMNETHIDVTWESSTIRSWLNGYGPSSNQKELDYTNDNFIDKAFQANEQNAIVESDIKNLSNPKYQTSGGTDTKDKLFLPSIEEVSNADYGFADKEVEYDGCKSRVSMLTAYAAEKSAFLDPKEGDPEFWILRSPGEYSDYSAFVDTYGNINLGGEIVDNIGMVAGVRPAMYLDLSSNLWSYAGTVSSGGTVDEPPLQQQKPKPIAKLAQTITAKSVTKTYGNKAFHLGAKAKTKLSYKSSNTKVATVNNSGKVTLKGPGKATITITAAATSQYNATAKKITITVKPKKTTLKKAKSTKKRTLKVMWKRDTKATGYQVVIAQNKKFKKGKKTALIKKNKTTSRTFKKLKSSKNYYYKVRAYKQVGKTKIYGAYSKTKRIKVR